MEIDEGKKPKEKFSIIYNLIINANAAKGYASWNKGMVNLLHVKKSNLKFTSGYLASCKSKDVSPQKLTPNNVFFNVLQFYQRKENKDKIYKLPIPERPAHYGDSKSSIN